MKHYRLLFSFLLILTLAIAATGAVAQDGEEDEPELGTAEDIEPTEEEVELFKSMNKRLKEGFIGLVKKHRELTPEALDQVSTAKIFLARDAYDAGLVDKVGYLHEAIDEAKKIAKLKKDVKIITYRRNEQPDDNIYNTATSQYSDKQLSLINLGLPQQRLQTGFYYLWAPGVSN